LSFDRYAKDLGKGLSIHFREQSVVPIFSYREGYLAMGLNYPLSELHEQWIKIYLTFHYFADFCTDMVSQAILASPE
jgi:hypothetical protein